MIRKSIIFSTIFVIVMMLLSGCSPEKEVGWSLPHLPRPIAEERAVITTAGQGPDGLIIAQLAGALYISHDYRKKITGEDLPGRFSSLIVVVGYSNKGLSLANRTEEEELERLRGLIERAGEEEMTIVLIHLGGQSRRGGFNEEAIEVVASGAKYMIVLKDGNQDQLFTDISSEKGIPLTAVDDIDSIKIPLNSAFR